MILPPWKKLFIGVTGACWTKGTNLPQLIVIDGGKGQLSSALKSLKLLGIDKQVTVIGIAKRLEELYYPGDQYPLYLDKKSETLKSSSICAMRPTALALPFTVKNAIKEPWPPSWN